MSGEAFIPIEIKPERVSDDIEVVLSVAAQTRDHAYPLVMAHTQMGDAVPEVNARRSLSNSFGDPESKRFTALVRVRIPRSMLVEQWTGDKK